MNKIFKLVFDIILIASIVLLSIYLVLRFLGITEIYKVETGSMEDSIHTGDYILILKKNNYQVGDIVTYIKDGYHVTHRIIKKNGDKVVTKGDANNTPDEEISVNNIVGKTIYHGKLLNFLIDFKFAIASLLIGVYLLSLYFEKKEENK